MYIWQFIIFIVLWFPIEYLCIYLEVKQNPDLFYALHEKQIIKALNNLDHITLGINLYPDIIDY